MQMRKIRVPVTVLFEGEYVAPGTEITLSKHEADELERRHGRLDADVDLPFRKSDVDSIDMLNQMHRIHVK